MLVGKSSYLKGFAPIIIEMAKRNMFPLLLCGPNPETSFAKSPSQKPIKKNMNFPGVDKVQFAYFLDFYQAEKIIKDRGITDVLTIYVNGESSAFFKRIKGNGIRTHYLQFYGDFLYFPPELIGPIDNFMLYSEAMAKAYVTTHNLKSKFYLEKIKIVGNPNIDLISKMSKWEIRKKYNLPQDKKIILFFSTVLELDFRRKNIFGSDNRLKSFLKTVYQRRFRQLKNIFKVNYSDIVKVFRRWADSNEALLIVKTKLKHKDPEYLIKSADIFFQENLNWYPPLSLELLIASDFVVSMSFSSTLESVAASVPCLQILDETQLDNQTTKKMNEQIIKNLNNVAIFLDYQNIGSFPKKFSSFTSLPRRIKTDEKNNLSYLTGPLDGLSSKRVLDLLLLSV